MAGPGVGAWFGWKLTRAGRGRSLGRAFGLTLARWLCYLSLFLAPKAASCRSTCGDPTCRSLRASRSCGLRPLLDHRSRDRHPGLASARPHPSRLRPGRAHPGRVADARGHAGQLGHPLRRPPVVPPPDEHAWVVVAIGLVPQLFFWIWYHDRVRCAVRNRRRGDRAAAGNGSRLDSRTRRARGDVASARAQCHPRPDLPRALPHDIEHRRRLRRLRARARSPRTPRAARGPAAVSAPWRAAVLFQAGRDERPGTADVAVGQQQEQQDHEERQAGAPGSNRCWRNGQPCRDEILRSVPEKARASPAVPGGAQPLSGGSTWGWAWRPSSS